MNQEDKELLLKDLSARLPYHVTVLEDLDKEFDGGCIGTLETITYINGTPHVKLHGLLTPMNIEEVRPYLRPMSTITENEMTEFESVIGRKYNFKFNETEAFVYIDWLNAHHFDYRGLIEKGLALEASEGMYY